MQIVAFAQGAPSDYQAVTISVNQPTSIQIKLDKYIVLGPFLIQATTFITIIIILFAIIFFVAVEIYRRKSVKASFHLRANFTIYPLTRKKFIWLPTDIRENIRTKRNRF